MALKTNAQMQSSWCTWHDLSSSMPGPRVRASRGPRTGSRAGYPRKLAWRLPRSVDAHGLVRGLTAHGTGPAKTLVFASEHQIGLANHPRRIKSKSTGGIADPPSDGSVQAL